MPSPSLLEWCTTSISSIQHSVHQIFNSYAKASLGVPAHILEIQALNGQKPAGKWKSFNAIVNTVVENAKNGSDLANQLSSIPPSLSKLVKINVAVKLQTSDSIVDALKSEDAMIAKKALSARWFFDGGNPNVTVEYFVQEILPFVSVRTRLDITNRLARGLRGHQDKARAFFLAFADLYPVHECLPLLTACSEHFIRQTILQRKIILPVRFLKILYSTHRDLVVNYLQLGNEKNTDNSDDRKLHEIRIHDYDAFLSNLIRRYPRDFVALYQLTPEKLLKTLSCRRSAILLTNVKDVIIARSDIFFKLLQPKIVKSKLTPEEIESALENYLPKDLTDFSLKTALDFLDDYSVSDDKVKVLTRKFDKLYGTNLLDYVRKLVLSQPTSLNTGLRLLRKLSATERENQVKMLLDNNTNEDVELKNVLISYLNPVESLPHFQNEISKATSSDERIRLIGFMIVSCSVKNDKKDLLSVLQYYKDRHKNEHQLILCQFFECLKSEFDLKALEDAHWSVLRDIIKNAYIRKQLFTSHTSLVESILEAALLHATTRKKINDQRVEEAIEMMVEIKMECFAPNWNVLKDNLVLAKECLERFFLLIPVKYPEHHSIWKIKNQRLAIALSLVKSIDKHNKQDALKKSKTNFVNLNDYPWILKLVGEFISCKADGFRKELLRKLVRRHAPDFYEAKMNENSPPIRDIRNGEALSMLKRHPEQVLANWLDYLNEIREKLHESKSSRLRAKTFVAATKWHDELPVKFIEACLADVKAEGSLAVLGILLPGETFEKVAATFVPKEPEIRVNEKSAKDSFQMIRAVLRGYAFTNPPISLESLTPFCRVDYIAIANGTLSSLARRVNVGSALEFVEKLANQPQATLMKHGIRLAKNVTTNQQLHNVLIKAWTRSSNVPIKKLLARTIFEVFVKSPHIKNWELMTSCLRGLTVDDKEIVQDLNEIEKIDGEFLSDYVVEYLNKVEELFAASLDFKWRTKCVCLLVESFDDKLTNAVSEEVSLKILDKYFFDPDCSEISRATRVFAIRYYLLPAAEKFSARLSVIINILKKTIESFDLPHPKKRRYYPANYTVQEFFAGLLSELCCCDSDKKLRVIESVLELFNMHLSPWQEPSSYLALSLYREYLLSSSPEDFGIRTAKRIGTLVEDFSSNEPIADITHCLDDFIFNKIFRNYKNPFNLKLSLIDGLLQSNEYYGALASIKLLNPQQVIEYDERYDRFLFNLRQMKNSSIQYHLYQHLNSLTEE